MKRIQKLMLAVLLTAYAGVTFAGHVEILGKIINPGGPECELAQGGKSRPLHSQPVWIYRKHIPTSTKLDIPSDTILSDDRILFEECITYLPDLFRPIFRPRLHYTRYLPRDPPRV